MKLFIESVGLVAPGLTGWQDSQSSLNGNTVYEAQPLERYKPALLPANERRRATDLVRLAFRVCEDTINQRPDIPADQMASVFASSGGDYQIIDQICHALTEPERMVSPTQFHNSVHNSAAGYWSIATGSRAPSNAISAHDFSFSAGLLDASMLTLSEGIPTLFSVYDTQPPNPLWEKRPIVFPFAAAFLLSPVCSDQSVASIVIQLCNGTQLTESRCDNTTFEDLRLKNPAARSLPLLCALAQQQSSTLHFQTGNDALLEVELSCLN